jgi:hypothetical protein
MSTGDFPYQNGTTGQVLITTGLGMTVASSWNSPGVQLELNLPLDPNFKKLSERIQELEKRLLVLHPNEGLHEKYPALKEAYEAYQIIEKLINGNQK